MAIPGAPPELTVQNASVKNLLLWLKYRQKFQFLSRQIL